MNPLVQLSRLGQSVWLDFITRDLLRSGELSRLIVEAVFQKDYNLLMGVELITAILTLVGLLLTDVIYALMDPRIRYT